MAGTKEGARKRTEALLKTDPNYFSRIGKKGRKGGKHSSGSFSTDTNLASKAGQIGGRKGKRGPSRKIKQKRTR